MTNPKSASPDLGLSAPYPYPTVENNHNSEWDKTVIFTDGEHDVALLPRSKFGHLSPGLYNRFVDGYLEASNDGEGTELPTNLAKLLNGIVPTGHPSKGENVPRTLLAEGACIVALVLGDVPTPLEDEQCRRIATTLRSEDWQLYEVSLSELVFGWDFTASEENRAKICGVILALLAFEEVQRCTAGAAQDMWAAEVQRRRASDDLLNTGRGEDPDYLSDETIQPRLAWDDDPTTPETKGKFEACSPDRRKRPRAMRVPGPNTDAPKPAPTWLYID